MEHFRQEERSVDFVVLENERGPTDLEKGKGSLIERI